MLSYKLKQEVQKTQKSAEACYLQLLSILHFFYSEYITPQ